LQHFVSDCSDFLVSLEASLQLLNAPKCYYRSLIVYASHPRWSKQTLQLQIFTTSNTTTSSSTSMTSSSPRDSIWSFKYLRRWFPTNLSRPPGALVINSVEPSSTDAWRDLHPVVSASGATATTVGEFVVVYVLDVSVLFWSKELLVNRSSFED
jgi:hypothetical protein